MPNTCRFSYCHEMLHCSRVWSVAGKETSSQIHVCVCAWCSANAHINQFRGEEKINRDHKTIRNKSWPLISVSWRSPKWRSSNSKTRWYALGTRLEHFTSASNMPPWPQFLESSAQLPKKQADKDNILLKEERRR